MPARARPLPPAPLQLEAGPQPPNLKMSAELEKSLEQSMYDPELLRVNPRLTKSAIIAEVRQARSFLMGAILELQAGEEEAVPTCLELAREAVEAVEWAMSERRPDAC